ncbi:tRNA lysidine(34) synthetase TilS [Globicatella sanguinis]
MEKTIVKVKNQLDAWKEWQQAKVVLLAVSGGVDSVVLLDIIYKLNQELARPKKIVLAHFNHHLRQESDIDANVAKTLAEKHQIIYYVKSWENPATKNVEAAARDARYQFFAEIIEKEAVDILLTGHHLNDLAETVLMRLTRGTSLKGLRGIEANYRRLLMTVDQRPVYVQMMRPLLTIAKTELYDYAAEHDLEFVEDASNQDTKYFRNRIRHQILPVLEQENPNFLENMLALQEQLQASYSVHYANYLKREPMLLMYSEKLRWVLYVPAFVELEENQRKVFLALFFEERLVEDIPTYTKEAIDRVDQVIMNDRLPNSSFQLNENWVVRREYDFIYIQPKEEEKQLDQKLSVQIKHLNHWHIISEKEQIGLFDERYFSTSQVLEMDYSLRLYLKTDQLPGFYVRHRKDGDRLALNDGHGDIFHKKVSRYMIDNKIPLNDRNQMWLLCDRQEEVIAIIGHISSRNYRHRHPAAESYLFLYRKMQD